MKEKLIIVLEEFEGGNDRFMTIFDDLNKAVKYINAEHKELTGDVLLNDKEQASIAQSIASGLAENSAWILHAGSVTYEFQSSEIY